MSPHLAHPLAPTSGAHEYVSNCITNVLNSNVQYILHHVTYFTITVLVLHCGAEHVPVSGVRDVAAAERDAGGARVRSRLVPIRAQQPLGAAGRRAHSQPRLMHSWQWPLRCFADAFHQMHN